MINEYNLIKNLLKYEKIVYKNTAVGITIYN